MDFVVMVNTESKGVQSPTMTKGNSKADLYKQLVYSYEGKNWSTNIPMWGEGTIASIQSGEYNIGELTLQRAIAKVNVTVNDGKGLENFENKEGYYVFHAGTKCADGQIVTAGGRVLGVTAVGKNIREAKDKAYEAAGKISFADAHYRKDIAWRALKK